MNPITLVGGFVPLVLFALLDGRVPVADAAAIAAAIALLIVILTARHGIPSLPIVQVVTLGIISVIAFTGDAQTRHFLTHYAGALASLALAAFMLVTLPFAPFTASIARTGVPREAWKSPLFIATNRKISAVWGLAVLVMGLCHLATAAIGPTLTQFQSTLLQWGPTIVVVIFAVRYTRGVVAQAQSGRPAAPQQAPRQQPRNYY